MIRYVLKIQVIDIALIMSEYNADHPHYKHTTWTSSWGFILAATGAAVGLGNIWKFPYMAGDNGGASFVLIYILAILLVGIPLMLGEILLGRIGKENPIDTMAKLAKLNNCSTKWRYTGWWGALTLLLTFSFYSVIAGWSVAYFFKYLGYTLLGTQQTITINYIQSEWQNFLASPLSLLFWNSIFMILTTSVVIAGVTSGIERASNIMMPFLFIILFILACYAALYGDFKAGFNFLFHVDFSKINSTVIIDALGHAFFTLAIGAGCMLTYGAYLPAHTSIVKSVFIISILDVMVAFLSGLAIFPIVFGNGLNPSGGPDLMFKVLPIAFIDMPAGNFVGCLFFLLLTFAAWTSSISFAEPLTMILVERTRLSRLTSGILVGLTAWILGIFSLLSFNKWSNVLIFNRWTFFDLITDLTTNILLPVGGLLFAIFIGWKLSADKAQEVLLKQHDHHFKLWQFLIKYIAPIAILLVLANGLL